MPYFFKDNVKLIESKKFVKYDKLIIKYDDY